MLISTLALGILIGAVVATMFWLAWAYRAMKP